jgi:hypothetical protein
MNKKNMKNERIIFTLFLIYDVLYFGRANSVSTNLLPSCRLNRSNDAFELQSSCISE